MTAGVVVADVLLEALHSLSSIVPGLAVAPKNQGAARDLVTRRTMKGDTMNSQSTEVIDEVSKWTVGLGILTTALAPLSIPFLLLTAAAVIPLAIPVLALGLVVATCS
jgi:hypothetical protein